MVYAAVYIYSETASEKKLLELVRYAAHRELWLLDLAVHRELYSTMHIQLCTVSATPPPPARQYNDTQSRPTVL